MSDRHTSPTTTPQHGAAHAAATSPRAPGAANPGSPRQATAGMPAPARRPLETGARGWRWIVAGSLLVASLACAAQPGVGQPADGIVALGTPLATEAEARAYLSAAARAPAIAPAWVDVYFAAVTQPTRDAAPGVPLAGLGATPHGIPALATVAN